ncbi:MAG TPA: class I SAM-dependent methyltransferase [Burkholderiales bacterium]|nr:class I SAM-dependent methyltransferase [Burkholderiales bacterium]
MSLRFSYTLIAPFYDAVIARASARARAQSLNSLTPAQAQLVLINGIGTGLDVPHLPPGPSYFGLDLTRAMLERAKPRASGVEISFVQGDALELPFRDDCFDYVVLHLILAVVPQPVRCLRETARVLKPGGEVLLLDKFLRRGERAWVRKALNPISSRVATRLDVVLEQVLAEVPALKLTADEPALLGGWFRRARLVKN